MSNFIAKFFRGSGRILLTIGAIMLLGMVFLSFIPKDNITNPPSEIGDPTIVVQPADSVPSANDPFTYATTSTLSVFLIIIIAIGFGCCLLSCNNHIRKLIIGLSNFSHYSIHAIELFLTTVIWGFCTALTFYYDPILAIAALFGFITNLLCFILAWLIYGRPVYQA